jgi:hypothetical protein
MSGSLADVGYKPLDVWQNDLGGDRHGVFDYTWVAPHKDGRHCYASLYIEHAANGDSSPWAEVWGALETGVDSPRSLVVHLDSLSSDLLPDTELRLRVAMIEAARRADLMRSVADSPMTVERSGQPSWSGLERAPYSHTVAATAALFERQPERKWRNREVLAALLELEFRTDRADVNAALSDLVELGTIRRLQRGVYMANS